MRDKAESIIAGFRELESTLSDPSVIKDRKRYQELLRRRKSLQPAVEVAEQYLSVLDEISEYRSILQAGEDAELVQMVKDELPRLEEKERELADRLKISLLPRDKDASRNIITEIRAGTGGEEAALFAADLFRMYQRYCERKGWKIEIMNTHEAAAGGLKEIIFSISGDEVFGRMKYESGVHRVQRVPVTEASGRIHTSAATVAILPEVEEVEIDLDPADLKIDVFRSSGPGGQSVNTTDSAVRVTHLPSGTVVTCQDEKSQFKNKAKALKVLRARLYQQAREEEEAKLAAQRRSQVSTGDRSAKIRTYNYPQGRVTDHRIGLTLYRLEEILDGDLDSIIDALILDEQTRKLEAISSEAMEGT